MVMIKNAEHRVVDQILVQVYVALQVAGQPAPA